MMATSCPANKQMPELGRSLVRIARELGRRLRGKLEFSLTTDKLGLGSDFHLLMIWIWSGSGARDEERLGAICESGCSRS